MQAIGARILPILKKYAYVLIALLVGLGLLLWPSGEEQKPAVQAQTTVEDKAADYAERLCRILSKTHGVGRCEVMLTTESGGTTSYAEQTEREQSAGGSSEQIGLAMQQLDGDSRPVVLSEQAPVFRGAAVVCEGADSAEVRLAVTRAVMAVTGLSSDSIYVLKMQ